ncbi:hypothetical protein MBT84_46695 [Streptomyces sp. MBT84]|nr:hypothetical protein [Streptomyces sp. MBT84]
MGREPTQGGREHAGRGEIVPCRPARRCPDLRADNLYARKGANIRCWAKRHKVELCFALTYASWVNVIEPHVGPLRQVPIANSHHPDAVDYHEQHAVECGINRLKGHWALVAAINEWL